MIKKLVSLLLAGTTIVVLMSFLRMLNEDFQLRLITNYWDGFLFEFRWSIPTFLIIILMPYLLIILISRRFKHSSAIVKGVIIGLISTALILISSLIIFRAIMPLPALLIITLSGFLFPLLAYFLESRILSNIRRE